MTGLLTSFLSMDPERSPVTWIQPTLPWSWTQFCPSRDPLWNHVGALSDLVGAKPVCVPGNRPTVYGLDCRPRSGPMNCLPLCSSVVPELSHPPRDRGGTTHACAPGDRPANRRLDNSHVTQLQLHWTEIPETVPSIWEPSAGKGKHIVKFRKLQCCDGSGV